MKKQRKPYTPEVAILGLHLVEGVPISDLCDELGLQPTVFNRWPEAVLREWSRGFPALRLIQTYKDHYNTVRLHSASGYVTPQNMLAGRQKEIHASRDQKLEEARRQRQIRRQQAGVRS